MVRSFSEYTIVLRANIAIDDEEDEDEEDEEEVRLKSLLHA